jgi:energy-coupling factor transport system ATP-binding protein
VSLIQVKAQNLGYQFENGKWAFADVNVTLRKSEIHLLAGANGVGKSFLLKCLSGLLKESAGEISPSRDIRKEKTAMIFQDPGTQILGTSVYDDIDISLEQLQINKKDRKKKIEETLEIYGLLDFASRHPYDLSGGERKKLSIASMAVLKPDFIFLDEPFIGLDYRGCRIVLETILQLKKEGIAVLVVSHDIGKVLKYSDVVSIMALDPQHSCGTIVAEFPASETLDNRTLLTQSHIYSYPGRKLDDLGWL